MPHFGELTETRLLAQEYVRMHTGIYTGDGNPTQTITGVGFRPRFIIIYERAPAVYLFLGAAEDVIFGRAFAIGSGAGANAYPLDNINDFIADGFVVGDSTGFGANNLNKLDSVYTYIAWG